MPTPTYVSLATTTLSATDTEVIFSSIPATYRDLVVRFAGSTSSNDTWGIRLNGDTTSSYPRVWMLGNGSSTGSGSDTQTYMRAIDGTTTQHTWGMSIMDYSATDKHKTALFRGDGTASFTIAYAFRWAKTDAVTSITMFQVSGASFAVGATFSLYGIAA
jgi:hypothetical protein